MQGDTKRQGELFGIKNIFRLHEDTLSTKTAVSIRDCKYTSEMTTAFQIERASVSELDWALAHLQGKGGRRKSKSEDWVHEADLKGGKEEVRLSPNATNGIAYLYIDRRNYED